MSDIPKIFVKSFKLISEQKGLMKKYFKTGNSAYKKSADAIQRILDRRYKR